MMSSSFASMTSLMPPPVEDIYRRLLVEEKVDLLLGGYGNNSITPAMPVVLENEKFLVGLMGLGVNNALDADRYFAMIPTGPDPNAALTEGFFSAASRQLQGTVAIVAADADFTKNPIAGARANAAHFGLEVISETKYSLVRMHGDSEQAWTGSAPVPCFLLLLSQ